LVRIADVVEIIPCGSLGGADVDYGEHAVIMIVIVLLPSVMTFGNATGEPFLLTSDMNGAEFHLARLCVCRERIREWFVPFDWLLSAWIPRMQ